MRRLNCAVQKYAWGKRGKESKVAQLKQRENASYSVKEDECYAELWMGTHPNGPSRALPEPGDDGPGPFLVEILEEHPEVLGTLAGEGDLPFLFKVLSINKALSIQAHPDKITAARIYAARPDLYKDDNHKPEMAVALSAFEGLCGFRPFHEIVYMLHRYPEMRSLVSLSAVKAVLDDPADELSRMAALRKLFVSYITCKPGVVTTQIKALVARLRAEADKRATRAASSGRSSSPAPEDDAAGGGGGGGASDAGGYASDASLDTEMTDNEEDSDWQQEIFGTDFRHDKHAAAALERMKAEERHVEALMLRLADEYPGDIGIVMPLLLNYLRMGPGEAFFMAANEPHAYLKGDLLEVMARSDNVVRVALTPKYRDVPLLCEEENEADVKHSVEPSPYDEHFPHLQILTYNMGAPPLVPPVAVDQHRCRYTPPVPDFELEEIRLPPGASYDLPELSVPQLAICLTGTGSASDGERMSSLCPGAVFFVAAGTSVAFESSGGADAGAGAHGEKDNAEELRIALTHPNLHFVGVSRSQSMPLPLNHVTHHIHQDLDMTAAV